MDTGLHFSSATTEWETPPALYAALDNEFQFRLDPAATPENTKCKYFYTKKENGLYEHWFSNVFLNPPYGREIGKWVEKAYKEVSADFCPIAVCLLPARTDTKWFHDYCWKSHQIRFIKGRIQFVGAKHAAPFPSMLVIFTNNNLHTTPSFISYDLKERTSAYLPR